MFTFISFKKPAFKAPKITKSQKREIKQARKAFLRASRNARAWDYSFLLDAMLKFFRWQAVRFKYVQIAEDSWWYSQRARLIASLIDAWQNKSIVDVNWKIENQEILKKKDGTLDLPNSVDFTVNQYVNTKNWKRYLLPGDDPEKIEKYFKDFPDELYRQKAKHLFFVAMNQYIEYLWD